jgi:hypothetical protein
MALCKGIFGNFQSPLHEHLFMYTHRALEMITTQAQDFESCFNQTADDLSGMFLHLNRLNTKTGFSDYLLRTREEVLASKDGLLCEYIDVNGISNSAESALEAAFRMACRSLVIAQILQKSKNLGPSWVHLVSTQYWVGMVFTLQNITIDLDGSISVNIKYISSAKGSRAVKARHERMQPLKTEVERLAIEKAPPKGWQSDRQAAMAIKNDVSKFAKENNSKDAEVKTISRWLSTMKNIPKREK